MRLFKKILFVLGVFIILLNVYLVQDLVIFFFESDYKSLNGSCCYWLGIEKMKYSSLRLYFYILIGVLAIAFLSWLKFKKSYWLYILPIGLLLYQIVSTWLYIPSEITEFDSEEWKKNRSFLMARYLKEHQNELKIKAEDLDSLLGKPDTIVLDGNDSTSIYWIYNTNNPITERESCIKLSISLMPEHSIYEFYIKTDCLN